MLQLEKLWQGRAKWAKVSSPYALMQSHFLFRRKTMAKKMLITELVKEKAFIAQFCPKRLLSRELQNTSNAKDCNGKTGNFCHYKCQKVLEFIVRLARKKLVSTPLVHKVSQGLRKLFLRRYEKNLRHFAILQQLVSIPCHQASKLL